MKLSRYNTWVEEPGGPAAVFNGLSGQLISLEAGEAAGLRHFAATGECTIDPARAEMFVRSRVLIADDTDELAVLDARFKKHKYDSSHLGLTLVTSLGCNFDCPYCYESKHPSLMSPDVHRAILDMVDDGADRLRGMDVTWMGGEPLLAKESLFELSGQLLQRCESRGMDYSALIVTNGWYLDGPTAARLAEHKVGFAQVTLDGPPDVHDAMRPRVGGAPTFWRIVENLHEALDHIAIAIRVNIDSSNLWRSEELMSILADQGFGGRLSVHCAKMTFYQDNEDAPVATYGSQCYTSPEYAQVKLEFDELALRYGLGGPEAPEPVDVPCTALAANALVVGSEGEIWKCWDHIGNAEQVIGDIRDYRNLAQAGVLPWLAFSPVEDPQCRECIALPSCMGGCLHHTLAGHPREAQCGAFRYNHQEQIRRAVLRQSGVTAFSESLPMMEASRMLAVGVPDTSWQPVSIGRRG